jgi:uncharacterized protein YbjT (DUF2867 family)
MTRILVTGATGTVGRTVTSLLATGGDVRVRALARDAGAAALHLPSSVEVAVGDFGDPASLDAALDRVDAVFLACANVPSQVDHESLMIDRAAAAGVRRLVKLSARGAQVGASVAFWHRHALVEQHLDASGIPAVVLQPSFFMSNLLAAAEPVREHGLLFAPAAHARISMVDPRDVAAVAATALVEDGHEGRTYVVTGPSAITYEVVAASLTDVLGRDVAYLDITPDEARRAMLDQGLPPFVVDQLGAVFTALRRGDQATTTDAVQSVTGRYPRAFVEFATEHATAFAAAPQRLLATEPR